MTKRIVFLDIDGPMIPSGMFLIEKQCSFDRMFSRIPVAVINHLCEESGAQIVMNTTHNLHGGTMLSDVVREGIKEKYLHPTAPMTTYPQNNRWWAIQMWVQDNGPIDQWVAIDDAPFTKDERLILIDFNQGLHPGHYNVIADMWGLTKVFIL